MISTAAAKGMRRAFVPAVDAAEAALVGEVEIIPVHTLADLVNHLSGEAPIAPHAPDEHAARLALHRDRFFRGEGAGARQAWAGGRGQRARTTC